MFTFIPLAVDRRGQLEMKKSCQNNSETLWNSRFGYRSTFVYMYSTACLTESVTLQKIGESWITQLEHLRKLEPLVNDKNFLLTLMRVKQVIRFILPYSFNLL